QGGVDFLEAVGPLPPLAHERRVFFEPFRLHGQGCDALEVRSDAYSKPGGGIKAVVHAIALSPAISGRMWPGDLKGESDLFSSNKNRLRPVLSHFEVLTSGSGAYSDC